MGTTLPPLHMPAGGQFSSLFPPILDFQTHEEITGKATALKTGTLPPLFSVPDLETPKPGFVLEEIDGDSDERGKGRLLGALGNWGEGKVDGVEGMVHVEDSYHDGEVHIAPALSSQRLPTRETLHVDPIWERAGSDELGPSRRAFELRNWDAPATPSPFRPTTGVPALAFGAISSQPAVQITLPLLKSPAALPAMDAASLLDLLVSTALRVPPPGLRWSRSKARFVYDVRHGEKSAAGFIDEILTIATAMRRLEIIVDEDSPALTATHHAFLFALSHVLDYMRHRLTDMEGTTTKQATEWLTRTLALEDVTRLANAMCEVACWPLSEPNAIGLPARPSSMLTHIYNHLVKHLQNAIPSQLHVTLCLAYILQHSTTPYLDVLHQWIGVADSARADEDIRLDVQPWVDLGITRSPLPPVNGEVRWEYYFSPRRMPVFIPPEMRRTFFEAGRSLRALRDASAGLHPLCWTDWPVKASWGWGQDKEHEYDLRFHARRVQRQIEKWRSAALARQPRSRAMSVSSMSSRRRQDMLSVPASPQPHSAPVSVPLSPALPLDELWLAASQPTPPKPLVDFVSPRSKTPLWKPTPDDLEAFIARHSDPSHPLLPRGTKTLEDYMATYLLAPPLAHATLISRALVSHYLDDLHFLNHLDVLHAFWLGGDAGFTERVNAALFGKDGGESGADVGLGRRARTRARLGIGNGNASGAGSNIEVGSSTPSVLQTPTPSVLDTPSSLATPSASPLSAPESAEWGVGLGIGLSDRRNWPPGGAELAYALRTTLFDHDIELFARRGPVWRGIEDRVSFALRALPEDENDGRRAQWLNPQAIEALDFLYLAYSPPAAIAPLLPVAIMDKYQVVHNLLLRLARVDTVLRTLYFDILRPEAAAAQTQNKMGVDAHHSRPVSKINQPTVQVAILGVYQHASNTANTLRYLRFVMSWFVTAFSRYVLDTVGHNHTVMHRRLSSLHHGAVSAHAGIGMSREPSRPMTPAWMILEDDELDFSDGESSMGGGGYDDSQAQLAAISQLQSAHSLVLYHHIILNRVTRACLLSRGSSHAFGALMALLSLVLDFGKAVKEIQRGLMSSDEGAAIIAEKQVQWGETYATFIKAVERLTRMRQEQDESEDAEDTGDEADLQILLGEGSAGRSTDLRELLLRLRLGQGSGIIAKWEEERRREREAEKEKARMEKAGKGKEPSATVTTAHESAATALAPDDDGTTETTSSRASLDEPEVPDQVTPTVVPRPLGDTEATPRPTRTEQQVLNEAEVELADELEMTPAPVVHETRKWTPPRPTGEFMPASASVSPQRLFQIQKMGTREEPVRTQSDDEISLD